MVVLFVLYRVQIKNDTKNINPDAKSITVRDSVEDNLKRVGCQKYIIVVT